MYNKTYFNVCAEEEDKDDEDTFRGRTSASHGNKIR